MKLLTAIFLFLVTSVSGQKWQAEAMVGVMGYQGDLTQHHFILKTLKPAVSLNLKYSIENTLILRAGVTWGKVAADDKNNNDADTHARNLNFQSNILEGSICAEYNLLDAEYFIPCPYIFGGIGLFHFDSYTFDKDNNKVYLRPLSTEGQGLAAYPDRKPYSQTQLCLPFGGGLKFNINKNCSIIYELGYRYMFTDYLDDVSKSFVDPQKLLQERGAKAVELAFRAQNTPGGYIFSQNEGDKRGNSKKRDWYFTNGIKFMFQLGKKEKEKTDKETE